MKVKPEDKYKGRGIRKCRNCGASVGLIRAYGLYFCRRCFRDFATNIGFKKYG